MALLVPTYRPTSSSANFTTARPTATGWGTQLTASATPHSLGTITQLISATTVEGEWIYILIHDSAVANTTTDGLVNIYIGGSGSETLLIASLGAGWSATVATGATPKRYWFPLRVPRGTRISAAFRALIASDVCTVYVIVGNSNGEHWVGSGIETLGANTAASRGTAFTPGAASEGSWASIGTTTRRYKYLNRCTIGNTDASLNTGVVATDIGSGSAVFQGLEGQMFYVNDTGTENNSEVEARGMWCDIPVGTALQMRGQTSGTAELQYGILYGVY